MNIPFGKRFAPVHGDAGKQNRCTEYRRWEAAKRRCFCVKDTAYPRYGGRGITMCDAWANSYEKFLSDMGRCPPGLSLERIDNNGNYEPGNCVWDTRRKQAQNTRRNVHISLQGETMCISEFARRIGRDRPLVAYHLRQGRTPEEIKRKFSEGKRRVSWDS